MCRWVMGSSARGQRAILLVYIRIYYIQTRFDSNNANKENEKYVPNEWGIIFGTDRIKKKLQWDCPFILIFIYLRYCATWYINYMYIGAYIYIYVFLVCCTFQTLTGPYLSSTRNPYRTSFCHPHAACTLRPSFLCTIPPPSLAFLHLIGGSEIWSQNENKSLGVDLCQIELDSRALLFSD
jgi:hypothetical protein